MIPFYSKAKQLLSTYRDGTRADISNISVRDFESWLIYAITPANIEAPSPLMLSALHGQYLAAIGDKSAREVKESAISLETALTCLKRLYTDLSDLKNGFNAGIWHSLLTYMIDKRIVPYQYSMPTRQTHFKELQLCEVKAGGIIADIRRQEREYMAAVNVIRQNRVAPYSFGTMLANANQRLRTSYNRKDTDLKQFAALIVAADSEKNHRGGNYMASNQNCVYRNEH